MRRSCLALLVLGAACAELPAADELAPDDDSFAQRGYALVPDGAVREQPTPEPVVADEVEAVPYADAPRLVVSRWSADTEYGTALCPFEVHAEGFPAVREDGTMLAQFSAETLSSSDGEDEIVSIRTIDVATDTIDTETTIVDGDDHLGTYHCWRWYERAKQRAAEVNASFATGWRPLERLELGEYYEYDGYPDIEQPEVPYTPHDIPVQLKWAHAELILRVPGVKVLARAPADWQIAADDPSEGGCWFESPAPTTLWIDRATSIAAVHVEQIGGPCFCYAPAELHALALTEAAIAEIDRRPRQT